ncbi:MAG: hypothetical protein WCO84_03505 [bacterium]
MICRCVSVKYIPGEQVPVPGTLNDYSMFEEGVVYIEEKNGRVLRSTSKKMDLEIELIDGSFEHCDIFPFFRKRWGRISNKRRKAIIAKKPAVIKRLISGVVCELDLADWLEQARAVLKVLEKCEQNIPEKHARSWEFLQMEY